MVTALKRVGAFILGLALFLFALIGTLGAALLVPLGMIGGWQFSRRRGHPLTGFQRWTAGVAPFSAIVILGLVAAVTVGPLGGAYRGFERALDSAQQQPQKQPAFLRDLNVPPPAPVPKAVAKPLGVIGAVIGVETWCVFTGTLAWAGVSLFLFGVRGKRAPVAVAPGTE